MSTLKQRLALAMAHRPKVRSADLARACGVQPPSVADWLSGKTKTMKAEPLRRAAEFLGCNRDWLGSGIGLPDWSDEQHPSEGAPLRGVVAQILSQPLNSNCPLISWGAVLDTDPLPASFRVAIPDDSMAPRLQPGQEVELATGQQPGAGSGVLVRDSSGLLYFRAYRPGRGSHWEAYPLNQAYQTLDSQRDGLELLAVLAAVRGDKL